MKTCTYCFEEKNFTEFYASPTGKHGIMSWCKDCHRVKMGRNQRDQRYKISRAEYNRMLEEQGGVCAVCRQPETVEYRGKIRKLGVDHDHGCCEGQKRCGKCNRGLLCQRCNAGLGNLRDDPALLRAGIDYLSSHGVLASD
jgi:hypothetical protein